MIVAARRVVTSVTCLSRLSALALCVSLGCAASGRPEPIAPPSTELHGGARAAQRQGASARDAVMLAATRWVEAGARFRGVGPWLGADSAYSVDLHDGRVLWLFGDTFIDPARDGSRTNGPNVFLRNSVALQTAAPGSAGAAGHNLSRSELQFFTGPERSGAATSFFPETSDGDWFWPLHGFRLEHGPLLLFRMRVSKVDTGFGFKVTGWDAVAVDDPDAAPDTWTLRAVAGQPRGADRLLGASVMRHDDQLYVYAVRNSDDDHAVYVARIALAELRGLTSHAFSDPEWFTARGYERLSTGATPVAIIPDGQIELSVHYEPQLRRFVEIQTRGLFVSEPATAVVWRTSPLPEGPWSEARVLWKPAAPAGADATKLLAYAAKAHPEQLGPGLMVTYMENDVSHPVPMDAVYYPEVLRVKVE